MADPAELASTLDIGLFQTACYDVLRIVSILSLDSTFITKSKEKLTPAENFSNKLTFVGRFFYMVFIKGFTPTVFDILPYSVFKGLTILIYLYKLILLPFWLRFTGFGKYTSWKDIGTRQPNAQDPLSRPLKAVSLSKETNLSKVDFGDPQYERFVTKLYQLSAHLSPHSQSPGNIFTHTGFPGNFFDHLTGVYKILLAWNQPQYIVRAGLFHSLYGTFDYRYSMYDLRNGRKELADLIGPGSEELAFCLCTSDRLGLIKDLLQSMYGDEGSRLLFRFSTSDPSQKELIVGEDYFKETTECGDPFPKLIGTLTKDGYPVRNHITQEMHTLPADFFAHFVLVSIADFMEQGAIGFGSTDADICLFQFMRYRFYSDLILFIEPFLRVSPPVWKKYLGHNVFKEATRAEVITFKKVWTHLMMAFRNARQASVKQTNFVFIMNANDVNVVRAMVIKYPYLSEPRLALAATMQSADIFKYDDPNTNQTQLFTRYSLADSALTLLEEWGNLAIKDPCFKLKEVMYLLRALQK